MQHSVRASMVAAVAIPRHINVLGEAQRPHSSVARAAPHAVVRRAESRECLEPCPQVVQGLMAEGVAVSSLLLCAAIQQGGWKLRA